MITLGILLILLVSLVLLVVFGGLAFLFTFGDIIIAVGAIVFLVRFIIKKKKGA